MAEFAMPSTQASLDSMQRDLTATYQGVTQRVPTFSFTLAGHRPREIAEHLASRAISTWDGDEVSLFPPVQGG